MGVWQRMSEQKILFKNPDDSDKDILEYTDYIYVNSWIILKDES